jgi:hypothetical protein
MRAKEKNRRRRFRENGILAVYLMRFFWFLATAKGLILWLMALWLCASSGSLPGLAGSLFPFSRRGRGLERVIFITKWALPGFGRMCYVRRCEDLDNYLSTTD